MKIIIPELTISNLMRGWLITSYISLLTGFDFLWTISLVCFAGAIGLTAFRILGAKYDESKVPSRGPVPAGKTRLCVTGYPSSGPTAKAHYLADLIAKKNPEKYETWYYFSNGDAYFGFLQALTGPLSFKDLGCPQLVGHASSPFVFSESGADKKCQPIGGCDNFIEWAKKTFPNDKEIQDSVAEGWDPSWYLTGKSYHTGEGRPLATCK